MQLSPQVIDPTRYPNWDEFILSAPGGSFFHSTAWAKVLSEAYGYTPLYFTIIEDGKLRALIPMMEVKSILTGKRGVSLPFTDYCEPLLDKGIDFEKLFNSIIEFGQARNWKYVELKGGSSLMTHAPSLITYLGHTLDISRRENEIFSSFRESTRRNIKKANREGVVAQISGNPEALKEFFRLHSITRRRHGLPPQPYHFFKKIYEHIFSIGSGFVTLASYKGQNIAGAVFFYFADKGIYKYGASDKKYQDLRANNLVMWEGIKWFCDHGYKTLCFGRTEPENKGLRQFKSGWGSEEKILKYFRYDLRRNDFTTHPSRMSTFATRLFNRMPISVLNFSGSVLYRHMG